MEVVIDQKGEETVIKIKGRLDTNKRFCRYGRIRE